jgi:uncharacterized protein
VARVPLSVSACSLCSVFGRCCGKKTSVRRARSPRLPGLEGNKWYSGLGLGAGTTVPAPITHEFSALESGGRLQERVAIAQLLLPHLVMPAHHDVRSNDVIARRLRGNLAAAADRGPKDFSDLLLTPGVGARTVQALAMVAEVMHGAPYRFTDPARFSFAHGGKDRHPFPVPIKVYDETIRVLKSAVQKAKLGREEELGALRRLDEQARRLERRAGGPSVEQLIRDELHHSNSYGGCSVFGWEPAPRDAGNEQDAVPLVSRPV